MILIEKIAPNLRRFIRSYSRIQKSKNAKIKILKNIKNKGSLKNKTKIKGNLIAK